MLVRLIRYSAKRQYCKVYHFDIVSDTNFKETEKSRFIYSDTSKTFLKQSCRTLCSVSTYLDEIAFTRRQVKVVEFKSDAIK